MQASETFAKLKLHFIHTHNRAILHWTMATPILGLYVMNKEQKIDVVKDFKKKRSSIIPYLNFNITLGCMYIYFLLLMFFFEYIGCFERNNGCLT
ncbi:hypothetical protein BDC45DRAFT_300690 [Circinella umbellata]|nr:hypothetical protein BDC45DRAFT_300690 [Circinella umbellata]